MKDKISTYEASKITGLTVRTLQYYDNIGILPASGRENGRRYYLEKDLQKLQHIVFYRGLGFSLEQIKDKLKDERPLGNIDALNKQAAMLINKINSLKDGVAAIEACKEIVSLGKTPPWLLLASFMQSLATADIMTWASFEFSDEQKDIFRNHFPTMEAGLEFYSTFRRLSIKAAAYYEADILPSDDIAQNLAKDWNSMVQKATGGKVQHREAYMQVNSNRALWNKAERELMERAEKFLEKSLEIYIFQKNKS